MNTRAKMRRSNQKAIRYMLENGVSAVWLMPHMRWDTLSYFPSDKIKSKDIFGVGDGICIKDGILALVQIKTNSKTGIREFFEFCDSFKLSGVFISVYDHRGVEMHNRYNKPLRRANRDK